MFWLYCSISFVGNPPISVYPTLSSDFEKKKKSVSHAQAEYNVFLCCWVGTPSFSPVWREKKEGRKKKKKKKKKKSPLLYCVRAVGFFYFHSCGIRITAHSPFLSCLKKKKKKKKRKKVRYCTVCEQLGFFTFILVVSESPPIPLFFLA
eukprot:TRINITY_DN5250_c0_g1_i2.p1 TRINITY_DN5250_c0_g1~~TRINITY_DN5250_c0_g1_i2.p1  ORF type:complete len:149 (+),score=2.86 TRINITY_DN5250_c0_g1_i2:321-767(+)